jgi:phosphoesterase RecJ-like protein
MSQTTDHVDYTNLSQQLDPTLVQQAMLLIEPAQRIALLAHERPDGDCLGSALGLAHILRELGKICVPACADAAPPEFSFLPGIETLQQTLGDEQFDLVIALDAGELSRYGSLYERHREFLDRVPIVNLDHHISSPGCGLVNIVDPISAATGELLVLFQQQARLPLNKDAAVCLLTGMITDTGSFQYSNTTARTMQAAAVLLQAGAAPESIAKPLFRTYPLAQLRLQAEVIDHVQTACDGRLIWSYATDDMLLAAGATEEMDDNFSGLLRDIEGVEIAAFFKYYGDPMQTRLSLRCMAPYNAATICKSLGGGGHARAAGATIQKPLQEAMGLVISLLKQELRAR